MTRIRDWKGLLVEEGRRARAMVFVGLLVASASLTFMQYGFIGIGSPGGYVGHVLGLLGPVAVTSLLLGKGLGTLMGLLCGTVLYAHALIQPLNIFERFLVTQANSIFLYAFAGFLLGLLFSIALRKDPRGWRRVAHIAIPCLIVAFLVTVVFIMNVVLSITFRAVETAGASDGAIPREAVYAIEGLGSVELQMWGDFAIMLVLCLFTDVRIRRYLDEKDHISVLAVFRFRLLIAALLVFIAVQAGAFVNITIRAEGTVNSQMGTELDFLVNQFDGKTEYLNKLLNMPELQDLSDETFVGLVEEASSHRLMDGYNLDDDGTVVVFEDDKVLYSNNPAYPVGAKTEEVFGKQNADVANDAAESGEMRQMVYSTNTLAEIEAENENTFSSLQMGYMRAKRTDDLVVMMATPASMAFAGRYSTMAWTSMLAAILLLVVYVLAARLLRIVMVNPIMRTNKSLAKITDGDLDEVVDEVESLEFAMLSAGINTTVQALKDLIDEAARRNESDLATAKTIQDSALPTTFPPFPEVEAFDIFAHMDAAKEVGGDFYDFFLIDDHTLGFLIADVSGKGIPGALFMMAAMTELENYLQTGMEPSEAIASANRRLCTNNEAGMFVTVWAATLDWNTGLVTYVNAGHNFPLLRRGTGANARWEWLKKRCGLFLGTFETAKYRQETFYLEPGDELLLYTDGVNEAFDANEQEYGNDRLEEYLAGHRDLHARELVRSLRADVASWAEGAEQSDDITILALEYGVAPEVTGSITVPATLDHLDEVTQLVCAELESRLCPVSVMRKVEMAVEELFVNVCHYAYANKPVPGTVQVSYAYGTNPSTITVELRDQGIPFDPVRREDPTTPTNLQEAKIGGLGIFMVKRSMDDLIYFRDDDSNVVVLKKGW